MANWYLACKGRCFEDLVASSNAALTCPAMKELLVLFAHLLATLARFLGPGGAKAVVADSLLMKQQLLVMNRSRLRAPNLHALDRILFGFWSLFLSPRRILRTAVILKPATLLHFHRTRSSSTSISGCIAPAGTANPVPKVQAPN